MVHVVVRHHPLCFIIVVATCIEVAREPREVAARDFDSYAMTGSEVVACRHRADVKFVDRAFFHEDLTLIALAISCAQNRLVQVERLTIWIHIQQFDRKIRVSDI